MEYRKLLKASWSGTKKPAKTCLLGPGGARTDIPVAKAQLMGRVADFEGSGRTSAWMASLKEPTWRAVRDAHTGHTIHVISDRPFNDLTKDLDVGLRILGWMSQRPVTWYWWDQHWTRRLPANTDPRQEHLNGGWAIPGVLEVHVYRREEAHKVMIHEAIHALGLDVPQSLTDPVRLRFEGALGRRLWPHFGEAFTELYAEWLWSVVSGGSWPGQMVCSQKQAAEIWARIRDATEAEDTNVFAYYIQKWVLMQHLDSVLLDPSASVAYWFDWWVAARPRLEELAAAAAATEGEELKMGMTCEAKTDYE